MIVRHGEAKGAARVTLGAPAPGVSEALKVFPFAAREVHRGIIDQRRLVQRGMRAVGELHRHHRLRGADRVERRLVVEIFLAVPQIRRLPPGGAVLREGEFGQLVRDIGVVQVRLVGEAVAEAQAVIEQAEGDVHLTLQTRLLAEAEGQFVVPVADRPPFTERLRPAAVAARLGLADQLDVALDLGASVNMMPSRLGLRIALPLRLTA